MEDYKNYLAANILSEDRVISYRLLSRALKVNVNSAKEMLYEFHQQQNAKKPGTIHATYLINGTKLKEISATAGHKDGEDEYMQSSPFMSSSLPQPSEETGETSVLSISLVREEDLESLKSEYEHISSIHVYSIGPHPLKDLQLLSDCTREVQSLSASEDPLEYYPKYGTIINPQVKRRPNRRPPPPVSAPVKSSAAAKPKPTESAKDTTKPSSTISVKQEAKQQGAVAKDFFGKGKDKAKPADTSEPSSMESTPVGNAPTLKKESSSIFKAFAKAKPKLKSEGNESSVGAEDEVMTDAVHFDEDEEETYVPPVQREEGAGDRKSRKEREAKLRAMMEEDDDEEESHPAPEPEPELELEEEEETILENEKPKEEPEPVTTVSGGRRRGKRRVMRKKTVKDDEGYLVTIEEPAWESFSEDEPAPPPMKARPPLSSASGPKGKKVPEKKGQGSIMSFFGKK